MKINVIVREGKLFGLQPKRRRLAVTHYQHLTSFIYCVVCTGDSRVCLTWIQQGPLLPMCLNLQCAPCNQSKLYIGFLTQLMPFESTSVSECGGNVIPINGELNEKRPKYFFPFSFCSLDKQSTSCTQQQSSLVAGHQNSECHRLVYGQLSTGDLPFQKALGFECSCSPDVGIPPTSQPRLGDQSTQVGGEIELFAPYCVGDTGTIFVHIL